MRKFGKSEDSKVESAKFALSNSKIISLLRGKKSFNIVFFLKIEPTEEVDREELTSKKGAGVLERDKIERDGL